jgi:peptide-methionine (S)-S-oxide reductase
MLHESATFAGGCFWCVEAAFLRLHGVIRVVPGYAGGRDGNPTYEAVCTGTTGHAEVIRIEFDPEQIGYSDLLSVFFAVHDPTTLNRQGNDTGTQYRSAIFYHDEAQKSAASEIVAELAREGVWNDPIVTEIVPLENYHEAEKYHHNYYALHPDQPYCQVMIPPKLAKLREKFNHLLRGS